MEIASEPDKCLQPEARHRCNPRWYGIDAQVRGDGTNLNNAHDVKARYYGRNPNLSQKILEKHGAITTVEYTSDTLNWRGVWSRKSWDLLSRLGIIHSQDAKLLSTHVLIGTINGWNTFNRQTNNIHGRGRAREGVT